MKPNPCTHCGQKEGAGEGLPESLGTLAQVLCGDRRDRKEWGCRWRPPNRLPLTLGYCGQEGPGAELVRAGWLPIPSPLPPSSPHPTPALPGEQHSRLGVILPRAPPHLEAQLLTARQLWPLPPGSRGAAVCPGLSQAPGSIGSGGSVRHLPRWSSGAVQLQLVLELGAGQVCSIHPNADLSSRTSELGPPNQVPSGHLL